jgi:hypothetical protein
MKTIQVYDQPIDHRPDHGRQRRAALLRDHDPIMAFSRDIPLFRDASYATPAYSWLAQRLADRGIA